MAKNQSHSFSQTKIAASLNRQNLWLLLNAWKISNLSLNLSEKKSAGRSSLRFFTLDKDSNSFDLLF
ncbi:hypothetical protein DB42_AQ00660 [Neochlamydia sp. EPS4]|nr:hypothetical protein DB42_AQ00660 [Neochlamydia sp. EPS4]